MIPLLRKNVAAVISNRSSFFCKFNNVPCSISINLFSTTGERISPRVYDVLVHKHEFSPQVASLAASALSRCRTPEKADSMLSFLKSSGFPTTQLEKIVKDRPGVLVAGSEDDIKFKIKIFQDLGLSPVDIAKMLSGNPGILGLSAKNNIIPSISLLKSLLGSDYNVARLVRSSGWFLSHNLERTLVPNVEFLKSCGVSMERIRIFLYSFPRCSLIKPDIMRESVDKVKEMGVSESSRMFVYTVRVIASMNKEIWEQKMQAFRNLGFSESDILTIFRRAPSVFASSIEKIRKVTELLLATGKFNMSSIVSHPSSLTLSVEKRYKPRLRILGILESKNLIKKWPSLGTVYRLTDDMFSKKFIGPYAKELGEEYITKSYVKCKKK